MANFIQENKDQQQNNQMKNTFIIIHTVMNKLPYTTSLNDPNHQQSLLYIEQLFAENLPINLLWGYHYINHEIVRLRMTMQMIGIFSNPLKITNQRVLIDSLRVIVNQNTNDRLWRIVIEQNHQIALTVTLRPQIICTSFSKVFQRLKTEVKTIIPHLIITLQPYCEEILLCLQASRKVKCKQFLKQGYSSLVLMETRKQMRKMIQQMQQKKQILTLQMVSKDHFFQQFINWRKKAYSQVVSTLKILRTESSFPLQYSQQMFKHTELSFKKWNDHNKLKQKTEERNVYGVKIISQKNTNQNKQISGTHCKVIRGKYELLILASINSSTNKAFKQLSDQSKTSKYERDIELVKKVCKNPLKIESLNSFKNQLDFIVYIKDRSCPFVSTFYWEFQKKKEESTSIMMEYYPHTLRSCIESPKFLFTLQKKLKIMIQISLALSWLSDNQVCHRDIKPQNIMLSHDNIPKIVDFGSCCPTYHSTSKFRVTNIQLLTTESYSLRFRKAPTWLKQRKYDKNCYEQHHLFDAYSLGKVMQEIFDQAFIKVLGPTRQIFDYLISRCLEVVPEDRPTYEQIAFILTRILEYQNQIETSP